MAFHIPTHEVVFFGTRDNPKAVRWWAERGQLHWEDSRTNHYGVVSVRDFLERLRSINDMLSNGRKKENQDFMHADEVERHMKFIEAGIELVRKAKDQGMPQDPQARAHSAMYLPTSVAMPSCLSNQVITPSSNFDAVLE